MEDVNPDHLRSYGPVHPSLQELLGPQAQRLAHLTLALADVANGTRDLNTVRSLVEEYTDTSHLHQPFPVGERSNGVPHLDDKEE
jgi:hypothetical protein